MTSPTKTLICIVGPTAIGKTALSIAFAKALQCDIISCDSRQFYKEMNIGTAVPEPEELAAAQHHFIQSRSIQDNYSVGDFEKEALQKMHLLFTDSDYIVMVGGSALYEKAITHGLDDFPEVNEQIKVQLEKELQANGLAALQEELKTVDPDFYNTTDIYNPRRIMRALSIYRTSGHNISYYRKNKKHDRPFNIIKIGLEAPREVLYERINKRVDIMIERGLLEEVATLKEFKHLNALQTVGYQEFFSYLEGKYHLEEAIRLVKRNTRRFAKRQLTWYRKDDEVSWYSYNTCHTKIVQQVMNDLQNNE